MECNKPNINMKIEKREYINNNIITNENTFNNNIIIIFTQLQHIK